MEGNCLRANNDCLLPVRLKLWLITSAPGPFLPRADARGPAGPHKNRHKDPPPSARWKGVTGGGTHASSGIPAASKALKQQTAASTASPCDGPGSTKTPGLNKPGAVRAPTAAPFHQATELIVPRLVCWAPGFGEGSSKSACTLTRRFCKVSLQPCRVLMSASTTASKPEPDQSPNAEINWTIL